MELYFLRHGPTENNLTGRINGRLDEGLSQSGRAYLADLRARWPYPTPQALYTSPAKRCLETAAILYPDLTPRPLDALWELSFGRWEGRLMSEAAALPVFPLWVAKDPACRFEGGESLLEAALRAEIGVTQALRDAGEQGYTRIAIVAHGALYRALFDRCLVHDLPPEALMLIPNGMGLRAEVTPEEWYKTQKFRFLGFLPENAPRTRAEDSPYFKP